MQLPSFLQPRPLLSVLALGLSLALAGSACQRQPATSTTACIDPAKVNPNGICTMEYDPVCGCDGKTYANACQATNAGVQRYTKGPCPGN